MKILLGVAVAAFLWLIYSLGFARGWWVAYDDMQDDTDWLQEDSYLAALLRTGQREAFGE